MGFQGKPCGCDCPSKIQKIRFSNFQTLENTENFTKLCLSGNKYYKELWCVEGRARAGCLKSVRAEASIKTVRERIRRNPVRKQIMSLELNISTQSSHASSGMIYTRERISTQRDTSYSCFEGDPTDKSKSISSSGTLRTGTKTSSRTRNFPPSRSSITTRQQDLCSNVL